jgi:hypothetical protein
MATLPEVFIIESLDPDDEGNGRFEGSILSSILRLHGKQPKYRYVRTGKQFEAAVKQFAKSQYRYLHISAHADEEGMCTTNQDLIDYDELAEILRPNLSGKRLFLSACSMTHEDLAAEVIPGSGCYSVVGPSQDIAFSDAAIMWSAIYHLMFSQSSTAMKHSELKNQLKRVTELFGAPLAYYSRSKVLKRGYTKDILGS